MAMVPLCMMVHSQAAVLPLPVGEARAMYLNRRLEKCTQHAVQIVANLLRPIK